MLQKTNVMRLLEQAKIDYEARSYPVDESDLSGTHAADLLGLPADMLFKTLVLHGERSGYFVCCIPASCEIDLKKAAKAAGDKNCDLIAMKELLPLTGYLRGGCSPIGMKKHFPTFIDETVGLFERVVISAGVRGTMLMLEPQPLIDYVQATVCDLI